MKEKPQHKSLANLFIILHEAITVHITLELNLIACVCARAMQHYDHLRIDRLRWTHITPQSSSDQRNMRLILLYSCSPLLRYFFSLFSPCFLTCEMCVETISLINPRKPRNGSLSLSLIFFHFFFIILSLSPSVAHFSCFLFAGNVNDIRQLTRLQHTSEKKLLVLMNF